jgi:hypothetical protein
MGDTMAYFSIALVGGCADCLRPSSGGAWEITETHCAVAHCGHRGHRERDDNAGLPHRGFWGESDMEQAVGCGIVYAVTLRSRSSVVGGEAGD